MRLPRTLGERGRDDLGPMLPHEHGLVDLGLLDTATERERDPDPRPDPEAVVETMAPELKRAHGAGVTALVECTPVGVDRRVDVVRAVSTAVAVPVVVTTVSIRRRTGPTGPARRPSSTSSAG